MKSVSIEIIKKYNTSKGKSEDRYFFTELHSLTYMANNEYYGLKFNDDYTLIQFNDEATVEKAYDTILKAFKYSHIIGVKIIVEYDDSKMIKSSFETIREPTTISSKKN